jgi:hypothetical protein
VGIKIGNQWLTRDFCAALRKLAIYHISLGQPSL